MEIRWLFTFHLSLEAQAEARFAHVQLPVIFSTPTTGELYHYTMPEIWFWVVHYLTAHNRFSADELLYPHYFSSLEDCLMAYESAY
jgi:hypothetical protein